VIGGGSLIKRLLDGFLNSACFEEKCGILFLGTTDGRIFVYRLMENQPKFIREIIISKKKDTVKEI
jgi:hypothetical protein